DEYTLRVPNIEILSVFRSIVVSWMREIPQANTRLEEMLKALLEGDIRVFERILNEFVVTMLSFYDTGGKDVERVYQAFLLGLLANLSAYEVTSNRESGYGRYDILLRPKDLTKQGFIMELKVCASDYGDTVEEVLTSALAQIEEKGYEAVLRQAGVKTIVKIAITFDGKRVWMKR
ncbi:MAG: PD-(D/E)XK nuclease domain-containing protein, partial [Bacteroides sp.]